MSEHHPQQPHRERDPGAGERAVNSYGTDDPGDQARIEQARMQARAERERNRKQLERYVRLGLTPDDAEALIEHEDSVRQQPDASPEAGEKDQPISPRIWVGSWLDYNNGILHGEWIDADREEADVWTDIQAMLDASPTARETGEVAEDWGIFDHENFGPYKPAEQESVHYVSAVARGIREHGQAFAAWADVMEAEEHFERFTDAYLGEYDSLQAYTEQLIDDLGYNQILDDSLPEHVRRYVEINVAGLAQDMWLGGDIQVYQREGGGVWVFDGRA